MYSCNHASKKLRNMKKLQVIRYHK
uniref:Uncharacterized protein n=1 Tax=Arundo donax TaxID=35708 RepID=A0A0A9BKD7_ARUDO